MVDIVNIKTQPLSGIIADYCECEHCRIVDRDRDRELVGHPCQHCGAAGRGGQTYFHLGVLSVINLIQEFYHTPSKNSDGVSVDSHKLAVVVFFCTLVETLLENLLREIMAAKKIDDRIQERLLVDNMTSRQRVEKLFPALAGEKWKAAVAAAERAHPKMKYQAALEFFVEAADARNKFLHPPGNQWAIGLKMPSQCLRTMPTLLSLFAWLHNRYIAKVEAA